MAASPPTSHSSSASPPTPLSRSATSPNSPASPHLPSTSSPDPLPPPSYNTIPPQKYDVFLSFRGEDTRQTFISHLYTALIQEQINTFVDDQITFGDEISSSRLNAIGRSKISVVILSRGYASARWCIDELVTILECKKAWGQIVIPVFYQVNPSEVINQTGIGIEFRGLEGRYKERLDNEERWRDALKEVSNLYGFRSSKAGRSDSELVKEVVEFILKKLNDTFSSDVNEDLVGIESCIKEIERLLSYGSIDVNTLGIWGRRGIGKTEIARVIFSRFSRQFDSSFFARNIREESKKIDGLTQLRRELLSELLVEGERLTHKKVLIVFDDVTCYEQTESLIGSLDSIMPGSLIIITTRNKQVLQICGVKKIYKMKKLAINDALTLFSRQAFRQNRPVVGYEKLSEKIMQYTERIPLAVKVLGCVLYGRSKEEWKSEVRKLKRTLSKDILEVLKISYDYLNENEQRLFLHIALFREDEKKDFVIESLNASGFSAEIGISDLVDKGLIVVSDNKVTTPSLLKLMAREIAAQEYIDDVRKRINGLRKHSRIDLEKISAIASFVLEIASAVFDQLSSVDKPQYALVSMILSFVAMLSCIVELVYRCGNQNVTLKWRSTLPWLYYPSQTHSKPFGNSEDIIQLIGLVCAVCQCIFATINFEFVRQHADNPIKISFWPIVFASGLLCSKFSENLVRRSRQSVARSTSTHRLQEILRLK